MATHIEHTWTLPADPQTVFAMLCDEKYQQATGAASGATKVTVTVESSGDGAAIRTVRTFPTDQAPSAMKAFVGDSLDIAIEQDWNAADADGSRSGSTTMSVLGKPLNFDGTCSLSADGAGTTVRISGDLRCTLPLIGGRVEQGVAPGIVEGFGVEEQQGREYLAG